MLGGLLVLCLGVDGLGSLSHNGSLTKQIRLRPDVQVGCFLLVLHQ